MNWAFTPNGYNGVVEEFREREYPMLEGIYTAIL